MAKELQELGEWKVGQECLLSYSGGSLHPDTLVKVTRITDGREGTIYVGETAFDTHGNQRGGETWSRVYLHILTPEEKAKFTSEIRRNKLARFAWKELPLDQSDMLVAFMREKGIKI